MRRKFCGFVDTDRRHVPCGESDRAWTVFRTRTGRDRVTPCDPRGQPAVEQADVRHTPPTRAATTRAPPPSSRSRRRPPPWSPRRSPIRGPPPVGVRCPATDAVPVPGTEDRPVRRRDRRTPHPGYDLRGSSPRPCRSPRAQRTSSRIGGFPPSTRSASSAEEMSTFWSAIPNDGTQRRVDVPPKDPIRPFSVSVLQCGHC